MRRCQKRPKSRWKSSFLEFFGWKWVKMLDFVGKAVILDWKYQKRAFLKGETSFLVENAFLNWKSSGNIAHAVRNDWIGKHIDTRIAHVCMSERQAISTIWMVIRLSESGGGDSETLHDDLLPLQSLQRFLMGLDCSLWRGRIYFWIKIRFFFFFGGGRSANVQGEMTVPFFFFLRMLSPH